VERIGAQKLGNTVEMAMELKDGNIRNLVNSGSFERDEILFNTLVHDMLKALAYVASRDIIHRDIKPENVLYSKDKYGQYTFQLTDFGLCNKIREARSKAGSMLYMVPEVSQGKVQTPKVDVW
jgi:serine/threonine protein kinase